MKKSTVTATFESSVEKVWDVVTDNNNCTWRSDLSQIIVYSNNNFSEYAKNGFKTDFTITLKKPYKQYEFDMKNKNMSGHLKGVFSQNGTGTRIEFTEEVEVKNPIMNLFVKSYLKKQQEIYIKDLKKALGE
ncbi:SRPBCC family protein [Clostridium chromiireducens]|uniref:Polyketide cyclase / dehydrase and lipid transport n=1 Tax=Clostridium chromiireducens TaxID=225345 RepID=A0A1V4IK64_9CLOT|nr:SRPBCC family protein [Clostridium chromiireducens]OPJ60135.1 polyketide cyclase / dehydrase and lipid transport [Clostridium chromiireducens]